MSLQIEIKIHPPQSQLSPSEMDALLDHELSRFETWFLERQRAKGNPNPSPLISPERGILKQYLLYLTTK